MRDFGLICVVLSALAFPASAAEFGDAPLAVCFSGGGFHSSSVMAGFMAGLQTTEQVSESSSTKKNLESVFANSNAVFGNSGGAWFLSMLSFSPTFVSWLSDLDDPMGAFTDNYLTNVDAAFTEKNSESQSETEQGCLAFGKIGLPSLAVHLLNYKFSSLCTLLDQYLVTGFYKASWPEFVQSFVYAPPGVKSDMLEPSLKLAHPQVVFLLLNISFLLHVSFTKASNLTLRASGCM